MPKSCSRCARNSTKVSESTRPVSIKSVSSDGTCTFSLSENSTAMRCSSFVESGMLHGLVLGGQQIVEQAVEPAAVDAVALEIGRASCRERGWIRGLEGSLDER